MSLSSPEPQFVCLLNGYNKCTWSISFPKRGCVKARAHVCLSVCPSVQASHHLPASFWPQNFLNAGSFPEIQGFLQLRGSGRKLWKRFFCFLRRSGLYYSTKGTSKVRY